MQLIENKTIVSVIMGVHNGATRVGNAIESILSQTFGDFELIICDDCSSDNTMEVLMKYAQKDKRIILLHNDKQLCLAATLNKCLTKAQGIYIARMDDDDISHPDRFEKQVAYMERHPECAVLGTKRINFDNKGFWGKFPLSGEISKYDLFTKPTFVHPSVMMRKDILDKVSGYTVSKYTVRGQDFDLWCKFYHHGYKGYILDDILLDYYDDRSTMKATKLQYRINSFVYHHYWRKKLKLPFLYEYYSIRPILVGLIPIRLLAKFRNIFKYH